MGTVLTSSSDFQASQPQEDAVRNALEAILHSRYFSGSSRSSAFLRYSVEHLLSGNPPEMLKERVVGIEVFHRTGDYDSHQDPVVRVTANDIRKRLAQYYSEEGRADSIRLRIPPGSYGVVVSRTESLESTPLDQIHPSDDLIAAAKTGEKNKEDGICKSERKSLQSRLALRIIPAVIIGILVLAAGTYSLLTRRSSSAFEGVWHPFLISSEPVVVSVAEPVVYLPASNHNAPASSADKIVPLTNAVVGVGDAYTAVEVARILTEHHAKWRFLPSDETLGQDLLSSPVILIGAYSNHWTATLMQNLRFKFGPENTVVDRDHPKNVLRIPPLSHGWKTNEDYAIITRTRSAETGNPVMMIGGITNLGTYAAAEFLSSPKQLKAALSGAPRGWRDKNFQIVIHTTALGDVPGKTTVVATTFW